MVHSLEQDLLSRMLRLRIVEETIACRYQEQKMRCPVHLSTGQEAVSAAVGACLEHTDLAVSGHRAHTHYLGKGGSLKAMLAEIYGKSAGCSNGKGGSMHLIDESVGFMGSTAIVGGTIPVGVGLGLSMKLKKNDRVACVFLGDGAVEEGAFYEAANFAVLKKLPVLFLCENNFYSVYSPLSVRQPKDRKISEMVAAMGCPASSGDGNDVMAVYKATAEAVKKIRAGSGPQFLEFFTYRWREHCGPNYDNHIGYRTENEFSDWKVRDPIELFTKQLLAAKKVTAEDLEARTKEIEKEVDDAFSYAEAAPFPNAGERTDSVYAKAVKA